MLRTFIRQYSLSSKNFNKKIAIISAQISKGQVDNFKYFYHFFDYFSNIG